MKILIIQTAFIGDVILATALIEDIRQSHPQAEIHFLLRKGNESLLEHHPHLQKIWIWNKKQKFKSQIQIIRQLRKQQYDLTLNLQRYFSSGIFSLFSKSKRIIGFNKNPLSTFFTESKPHEFVPGIHEIDRNHALISSLVHSPAQRPKLYPTAQHWAQTSQYKTHKYIVMAPTSVWFTKQWPVHKWIQLCSEAPSDFHIFLVGAPADTTICQQIATQSQNFNVHVLTGKLSLLHTAALMADAHLNIVNDSAPLHLASAMNAPVAAIFCSTSPTFGYTPLSDKKYIIQANSALDCHPCGIHGHKTCPKQHYRCAEDIATRQILSLL
ncbi:MAG: hypothetical protein RIS47_1392 [Bacteroidota bacterium]